MTAQSIRAKSGRDGEFADDSAVLQPQEVSERAGWLRTVDVCPGHVALVHASQARPSNPFANAEHGDGVETQTAMPNDVSSK